MNPLASALDGLQTALHAAFPEGLPTSLRTQDLLATQALTSYAYGRDAAAADAAVRWAAKDYGVSSGEVGISVVLGEDTILDIPFPPHGSWTEEQARTFANRIVACVNACSGIADDDLPAGGVLNLRNSALAVVSSWEDGDLAGAVGHLQYDAEALGAAVDDESEEAS